MLRHLFIHLLILQPLKTNVKNLQNNNLQMLKCKAKGVVNGHVSAINQSD